jgi:hypothetical protein
MRVLFALWACLFVGAYAAAAGQRGASAAAVVELFTSEGCSSCPPAEAVLEQLSHRSDVITLAHHVTYWDSVSWRDHFASAASDQRQATYVRDLGLRGAYTPQAVVDGRLDVLGSDRGMLERAIAGLEHPAHIQLALRGKVWVVTLPAIAAGKMVLRLLAVRRAAETAVGGGENRGRTIHATSIVRAQWMAGAWSGGTEERVLDPVALPTDADEVVVLAERVGDGRIVAAGRLVLE